MTRHETPTIASHGWWWMWCGNWFRIGLHYGLGTMPKISKRMAAQHARNLADAYRPAGVP